MTRKEEIILFMVQSERKEREGRGGLALKTTRTRWHIGLGLGRVLR